MWDMKNGPTTDYAKRSVRHRSGKLTQAELVSKLEEAEKKIADLTRRNEALKKENQAFRTNQSKTEQFLQEKIRGLESDITKLTGELESANKLLAWFRNNQYGKKTEQSEQSRQKNAKAESATKPKKSGNPGNDRSNRSEIETEPEVIQDECNCGVCGKPYRMLDRVEPSSLIEIDIHLTRLIYLRAMYVSACDCEGKKIHVAPAPKKLFPRTEIGTSLWVRLIVQKFLHGVPTNRTLKELRLLDLHLAAGTVVGGFKVISKLLGPLAEEIRKHCQGATLWNADETTWRVFNEEKTKWWMWLFASKDAVVYVLDPSRSKNVPTEFFGCSMGVLMTDRYSSYKSLKEAIRKAYCWVHVRRDILNVFKGIPSLKPWATKWLLLIAELFALEHKRFALWKENRTSGTEWENANLQLELHVAKLKDKWETELKRSNLHKEQSKILRSFKRHWTGLTLFLQDSRIPLHNNRAERLLRNLVCLRKNSLGSGAQWSGEMCAMICGIFQTWLINDLDPQALLQQYFDECAQNNSKPPPDIGRFLPWKMTDSWKKQFALPETYQKPG